MYDGGKIITGIIIFLLFATFPFYYNIGKANVKPDPKLDTPVIKQLKEKKCVESKAYMRAYHMQLLNKWRNQALRKANRTYRNEEGKLFQISLQNTCMRCHSNKQKFCDECHKYAEVKPYCWDCHFVKEAKEGGAAK